MIIVLESKNAPPPPPPPPKKAFLITFGPSDESRWTTLPVASFSTKSSSHVSMTSAMTFCGALPSNSLITAPSGPNWHFVETEQEIDASIYV